MKECPYCHTPARFEAQKFCSACGKPFPPDDAATQPAQKTPEVAPQPQPKPAPRPEPVPQPEPVPAPQPQAQPAKPKPQEVTAPESPAPMPVRRRRHAAAPEEAPAPAENTPAPPPVARRQRLVPAAETEPQPCTPAPKPKLTPTPPPEPVVLPTTSSVTASQPSEPALQVSKPHPEPVSPAPKPQPTPKPQAEVPAPAAPVASVASTKPVRNANPLVLGLVVLVIVLVAALAFVLLNGRNKDSGSADVPPAESSSAVSESQPTASESTAPAAETTNPAASEAAPEATALPSAVASDTQVVIHNAVAEGATITVDGKAVQFSLVGTDAVITRDLLPDVCQIRIIAPAEDGGYQTAAVWYNKDYGNELSFAADYGEYVSCDATGRGKPSDKVVDVLTWAFYRSFLTSINNQNLSEIRYSTAANTIRVGTEISDYFDLKYNLDDFSATCTPSTILYSESDGSVVYDGTFRCYYNLNGTTNTSQVYRTVRLVWEDGVWKVDAFIRIDEPTYQAGAYGQLP